MSPVGQSEFGKTTPPPKVDGNTGRGVNKKMRKNSENVRRNEKTCLFFWIPRAVGKQPPTSLQFTPSKKEENMAERLSATGKYVGIFRFCSLVVVDYFWAGHYDQGGALTLPRLRLVCGEVAAAGWVGGSKWRRTLILKKFKFYLWARSVLLSVFK